MAENSAPGKLDYVLDGQPVGFVNSNDNKLIIRSEKPTVTRDDLGIVRPTTGALALSGTTPFAVGIIEPPVGAIALAGKIPVFPLTVEPTAGSLALAGKVPILSLIIEPTVGSLALTGQIAARWTGLWFEGNKPTTVVANVVSPTVGALALTGIVPDAFPDAARSPITKAVALAGQAPLAVVSNTVLPTLGAVTIQGRLTSVYDVVFPSTGSLNITGYAPTPAGSEGQVSVLIQGPFEYGTFIRNQNATTEVPVNYQIDDRTGFKVKVKDPMVLEYTGNLVRPDSLDKRSEQEFLRSKGEHQRGPLRPEPSDEKFVEDEYPTGVTADDL